MRPVVECACPVWHTNLPNYLSDDIETIQKRALKSIFHGKCYIDNILNENGMITLKERRGNLCKKYLRECSNLRECTQIVRPRNTYPLPQNQNR